jgi:histone H2B
MAPPKPSGKGAKKAVKSVKSTKTGDKKRRKTRKESYSVSLGSNPLEMTNFLTS